MTRLLRQGIGTVVLLVATACELSEPPGGEGMMPAESAEPAAAACASEGGADAAPSSSGGGPAAPPEQASCVQRVLDKYGISTNPRFTSYPQLQVPDADRSMFDPVRLAGPYATWSDYLEPAPVVTMSFEGQTAVVRPRAPYRAVAISASRRHTRDDWEELGETTYYMSIKTREGWFFQAFDSTWTPGYASIYEKLHIDEFRLVDLVAGHPAEVVLRYRWTRSDSNLGRNELEQSFASRIMVCGIGESAIPSCTRAITVAHEFAVVPIQLMRRRVTRLRGKVVHVSWHATLRFVRGGLEITSPDANFPASQRLLLGTHLLDFD